MEQEYQLDFFKQNGFHRRICPSCKGPFWTLDAKRELCGDPPCVQYSFIGNPATKRPYTLHEMREAFLGFFERKGHHRVARYPVVARWRDDIYLTIASIADFQPHVTSGEVAPPANPLTISQPCIRLNDLDSVGKSGRHLTTFEMMAHHVFNTPEEHFYFKDRTVELCHEFLTKELGMPGAEITYKENPWAGGGNAGPAIEVMIRGLEVATLVFMMWVADPNGPIDVKGEKYRDMPLKIVDTGYGLERLVWMSNGAPTIYDSLFPDAVRFLLDETNLGQTVRDPRIQRMLADTARASSIMSVDTGTKVLELRRKVHAALREKGDDVPFEDLLRIWEPLEKIYALTDHARCLAFMLGDGIVPSNVKAGYLMRMVIRRSLRLMDELGLKLSLFDIVNRQLQAFATDFPELFAHREYIHTVLELETARYHETLEKGKRLVEREAKAFKGKEFPLEKLIDLYDTQGLNPEIVKATAEPLGVKVDVPDDFYSAVANKHAKAKAGESEDYDAAKEDKRFDALPPTRAIYYEDSTVRDFHANVVWAEGDLVVLDQTCFYPEGGGQPHDVGHIHVGDHGHEKGPVADIIDVQKYATPNGNVVVHKVRGATFRKGDKVHGHVDWDRRTGHTRHHTATHLILASAKQVLGFHTWQGGAQKGYERSRVDIQHYNRITDDQLRAIEELANKAVLDDRKVDKVWMPRDQAEKKFGMQLYQGGIPKGHDVRVVTVQDYDVECCGGTHVATTTEIGPIKILRSERVQDGLERIEFSAGLAAIRQMQKKDELLKAAAETLSVQPEELPKTTQRFFEEWKQQRKEIESLKARLAELESKSFAPDFDTHTEGTKVVAAIKPVDAGTLRTLAMEYAKQMPGHAIVVANPHGHFVVAGTNAVAIAKKLAAGRAGGKDNLAQGSIPDFGVGDAKQAVEKLRKLLG
ncbi:MAG: alanyl-tRNA synthetase [Thermoplasmata archaeon]|nr:alanyl-tRNA synthetase [Thermoplasmata archaeon]